MQATIRYGLNKDGATCYVNGVDLGWRLDYELWKECVKSGNQETRRFKKDCEQAGIDWKVGATLSKLSTEAHILDVAACNRNMTDGEEARREEIPEEVVKIVSQLGGVMLVDQNDPRGAPFSFYIREYKIIPAFLPV